MKAEALRTAKDLYRRIPVGFRVKFESAVSPVSRRYFLRGLDWSLPAVQGNRPVSIVIPSYNDLALLKPLLASISRTISGRQYEVIISDDYCQDSHTEQLRKLETSLVSVVTGTERTGFAGAVNRGIERAQWDVVLLNSDMIALPGWLEWLEYCAYEVDPLVGMVSPHLIYPTGRIQYGGTYHSRHTAPQWFAHLFLGRPANFAAAQQRRYVRANCGAAIYIKQSALHLIGPLDDEYWLGFEDVDWSFRAWQAGIRCMIEPASRLLHLESATRGLTQGPREYASMRRFWRKWNPEETASTGQALRVVVVHDQHSTPSQTVLAESLASAVRENLGLPTDVYQLNASIGVDEEFVSVFSEADFKLIALDRASLKSVWLASVGRQRPIAYFSESELAHISDVGAQSLGELPPEFDYVIPTDVVKNELRHVVPWPTTPLSALPAAPRPSEASEAVTTLLLFGMSSSEKTKVRDAIHGLAIEIRDLALEDFRDLQSNPNSSLRGTIAVCGTSIRDLAQPLALMSLGAIVFYEKSIAFTSGLLDGYNSFSFSEEDTERMGRQISALIDDPEARSEIWDNASRTVSLLRAAASATLGELFRSPQCEVLSTNPVGLGD